MLVILTSGACAFITYSVAVVLGSALLVEGLAGLEWRYILLEPALEVNLVLDIALPLRR